VTDAFIDKNTVFGYIPRTRAGQMAAIPQGVEESPNTAPRRKMGEKESR
jgi:hypothetical protein